MARLPRFHARTVILEPAADKVRAQAFKSVNRAEEAFTGLEWNLARTPDRGLPTLVKGTLYRVYVHASSSTGVPTIWVAYTFDANEVVIVAIKFI